MFCLSMRFGKKPKHCMTFIRWHHMKNKRTCFYSSQRENDCKNCHRLNNRTWKFTPYHAPLDPDLFFSQCQKMLSVFYLWSCDMKCIIKKQEQQQQRKKFKKYLSKVISAFSYFKVFVLLSFLDTQSLNLVKLWLFQNEKYNFGSSPLFGNQH